MLLGPDGLFPRLGTLAVIGSQVGYCKAGIGIGGYVLSH